MKLTVTALVVLACSTLTPYAVADNSQEQLLKQRNQFESAADFLRDDRLDEFRNLQQQLQDYPLAIYLEYYYLINHFDQVNQGQIIRFSQRAADSALADRLQRKWLNYLADSKKWQAYQTQFAIHPIQDTRYVCQQLVAQLNTGNAKQAISQAAELWQVGYSQPKACDPLFDAWMKQGHPTSQEAYTRFWQALAENELTLARYAAKHIQQPAHKQTVQQFWSLYNHPEKISSSSLKNIPGARRSIVLELAFKKWFRQKPISATERWLAVRDQLLPSTEQRPVSEYMGLRLNWRYHPDATRLSQQLDPGYSLPELTETRIRHALQEENWFNVREAINHLPPESRNEANWRYWSLIADRHLEPEKDISPALKALAMDRSYYGFLAAELSGADFQLNPSKVPANDQELKQLEQLPAVVRARELFYLGRLTEANREWAFAKQQMDENQLRLAGHLAHRWGWHLQAIISAAQTDDWNNIQLRFPHPHARLFKTNAIINGMDLSFPIAIARQESAFLSNARSHVGARGLMQLMPATARLTAKRHNIPYKSSSQLGNPELNITLGSAYLGDMLKKFNGNPAYAAAAYNAGPHRVTRWLKERGDLPLDVWVETIPFSETRNYVQNVLAFRVIYDRLDGRQASLLNEKQVALLALNRTRQNRHVQ